MLYLLIYFTRFYERINSHYKISGTVEAYMYILTFIFDQPPPWKIDIFSKLNLSAIFFGLTFTIIYFWTAKRSETHNLCAP